MAGARNDIDLIRRGLMVNMTTIARQLFPHGRLDGHRYWPASTKAGKTDSSLCIDVTGPTAGRWIDFGSDEKGDAIDLIAHFQFNGISRETRSQAIQWAANFLGLGDPDRRRALERVQAQDTARSDESHAARTRQERAEKANKAKGWWLSCNEISGTRAEAYLNNRGIDLKALAHPPRALRFTAAAKHPTGTFYPAMMAAMCDAKGTVRAVHRTFLAHDGAKKAPVENAKLMWGDARGTSIRLSKGRTGLTPSVAYEKGVRDDTQVIVEGIEDGLTWAMVYPEHRVSVAGSLSAMAAVPLFSCANHILVVADRDEPGSKPAQALTRVLSTLALRASGSRLEVVYPDTAKDINDVWKQS